tara:strand:- start:111 stop:314 length:204 start_codon:yes stop_codon:yes gene_type:complete
MSKTLYYRETNPETGKSKWIKFEGILGDGKYLTINLDHLEEFTPRYSIPSYVVYKSTKETRIKRYKL